MESGLASDAPNRCDAASEHALTDIRRRLCSTGYQILREIECDCSGGIVVLRGRVSTYYLKQIAQATLLGNPAIKTVVNLIEVSSNAYGFSRGE